MKKIFWAVFFVIFSVVFALPQSAKAAPPAYFHTSAIISSGLSGPTGFEFAPDGRIFILQRTGEVKVYKNGQLLPNNFTVLPSLATGDRGLIGVTFDPDFANNKFVYFYYTAQDKLNYLVRFSAAADTATDNPVIIYHTTSPSELLHVGGSIGFGADGKLYFTVGDNGYPPNAQVLDNPHGKILRINKDGSIPADNPFVNTPGALPEIWAYGLRNPWRFQFDSVTGKMYDGDVGANTWEEVNRIEKGKNYGWPTCEGNCGVSGMTNPLYTYNHDNTSSAVTGGPVYRGSMFPNEYYGRYFFGDYARGFIKTLSFDGAGNVTNVENFDPAAGTPVDFKVAADGSLYYINYYPGRLYRINYSTGNQIPTASAGANVTKGPAPLAVNFTSAGTIDPDNDPLTYFWDFGDGQTSTAQNPSHTYQSTGTYIAQLTVSDGVNTADAIPISIQVGIAPTVIIGSPQNNSLYTAGDQVTYAVSATDGVGNDLNDNNISVEVLFHHHTHIHPFYGPVNGRNGTITIPTSGEPDPDTWFEFIATATDTGGLSTTKSVLIYPRKSQITLATNPAGLEIKVDGEPMTAPQTFEQLTNFHRELSVATEQYVGDGIYQFTGWSDGGAQTHTIAIPAGNTTYTANFTRIGTVVGYNAQYFNNMTLSGSPALTRVDQQINFDWGVGSPNAAVNNDNFSARWTKTEAFSGGTYEFTVTTDDGVRLYVDGQLLIDKWQDQGITTFKATKTLSAANHEIKLEYYENGYDAVAKLSYVNTTSASGNINAQYFNNMTLSGAPVLNRQETEVNYDWGVGSPAPAVTVDNFSARWTTSPTFENAEYKFTVSADDGVRLFIDNQIVIDKWIDQGTTTYTVNKTLTAGVHEIKLEYYENGYDAVAKMSWLKVGNTTPPTGWNAEYWNIAWTGALPQMPQTPAQVTRTESAIANEWGQTAPVAGINADDFIARWTKTETFTAGNYQFVATADDGVRVYVDNNIVIDKWLLQGATTYTQTINLTAGAHTIKVEYFDHQYDATAKISWVAGATTPPPPTNGFSAEYFNNMTLTAPVVVTKTDDVINFDWGFNSPTAGINPDQFSVRWTKAETFAAGTYTFSVTADDGVRLKIDGETIIDKWQDQGATTYTAAKTLTAGSHTIVMEYYENGYDAIAKLSWTQTNTPPPVTGFSGQYFANMNLSGTPTVTRNDASINFDWGNTSPDAALPADHFSARWTKTENFDADSYRFTVSADDGIRLKIDGNTVIDKWIDQSVQTFTTDQTLTAGNHTIVVEYYENAGDAVAKASWQKITTTPTPPAAGFQGQYFNNTTLTGTPVLTRTDAAINFTWDGGSPDASLPIDNFSARWTKSIQVASPATYHFSITGDDGVRVFVDGIKVIDGWKDQGSTNYTADTALAAGNHTIIVEYYEAYGGAVCNFSMTQLP